MAMTPALSAMLPILITHIAAESPAILSGTAVEKNPEEVGDLATGVTHAEPHFSQQFDNTIAAIGSRSGSSCPSCW